MQKNFVLDTNVLLHDPEALLHFEDNTVVVPIYVVEEIDKFKRELSERGRNARQAARLLDTYRERGSLSEGVRLEEGGLLRVMSAENGGPQHVLDKKLADNLILAVALDLKEAQPDRETIFITMDTNLRIRANAMGLKAVHFEESETDIEHLYPGAKELTISDEDFETFFQNGELRLEHTPGALQHRRAAELEMAEGRALESKPVLFPNEYLLLRPASAPGQSGLGRFDEATGKIVPLKKVSKGVWGIRPKNKEQHFALDALLNPDIKLVTLLGKAGTGKTLLAIAAGLAATAGEHLYKRLLVARPIFPLGRDIGHLPGDLEQKLNPWMQPIRDNIEFLMGLSRSDTFFYGGGMEELLSQGILEIEPLTFIRGRSIPGQYMIIDEAQNLTPHETKTILTRAGDGTKIVLTGDPFQIDNPYVDSESNGLTHTISRFKGQRIAATVTLSKGERSELAEIASNLL